MGRCRRAVIDGVHSDSLAALSGVPHCSVLGKSLFLYILNMFVNYDAMQWLGPHVDYLLLWISIIKKTWQFFWNNLVQLEKKWSCRWEMLISIKLLILMDNVINTCPSTSFTEISMGSHFNYLAVEISNDNLWDRYIKSMSSKVKHRV